MLCLFEETLRESIETPSKCDLVLIDLLDYVLLLDGREALSLFSPSLEDTGRMVEEQSLMDPPQESEVSSRNL